MTHEVSGQNVDVILIRTDVGIVRRDFVEAFVPERHGEYNAVGFCGGGEVLLPFARELEGKAHDALHTSPGEDGLLHGHFVGGSFIEAPADIGILAFVVFPHDGEVNLTRLPVFQRRINALEEAHRAQVDVLPKPAADRNQKSP